jgi:hypothetical protein
MKIVRRGFVRKAGAAMEAAMSSLRQRSALGTAAPGLFLALSACSMAPLPLSSATAVSHAPVSDDEGTESGAAMGRQPREFRITCKYEMGNCERRARKVCSGPYDVVNRGNSSCADCGLSPSFFTDNADDTGTPVYQGSLHVRCR